MNDPIDQPRLHLCWGRETWNASCYCLRVFRQVPLIHVHAKINIRAPSALPLSPASYPCTPRLGAILILLSFLLFVATSSPHRVHHLGDSAPSPRRLDHDHPEPHDHDRQHDHPVPSEQPVPHPHEGQPSPLPECVVLFLLQSSPMLGAEPTLVAALEPQPLESRAHGCCPLDVHTNSTRIRAPPVVIL